MIMNVKNEYIKILCPKNKLGPDLYKREYELLRNFILELLEIRRSITLTELLEIADREVSKAFRGSVSWSLLQVKQDLIVRGLLHVKMVRKYDQIITLKKLRKKLNLTNTEIGEKKFCNSVAEITQS